MPHEVVDSVGVSFRPDPDHVLERAPLLFRVGNLDLQDACLVERALEVSVSGVDVVEGAVEVALNGLLEPTLDVELPSQPVDPLGVCARQLTMHRREGVVATTDRALHSEFVQSSLPYRIGHVQRNDRLDIVVDVVGNAAAV